MSVQRQILLRYARGGTLALPPGRGSTPVTPPPPVERFAGDPGSGKVLTGATVYTGSGGVSDGNAWLTSTTGVQHLMRRRYYTNSFWTRSEISGDHSNGGISMVSMKLSGDTIANAANILNGSMDSTFKAEAQWAASQGYPIYADFYHEPEDNWDTDSKAAQFRGIFRRIAGIFKDNGATNVNWFPIYMAPWTFQISGGEAKRGPWWKWDPDWRGTVSGTNGRTTAADFYTGSQAVCNMMGFDQYVPFLGTSGYAEFSSQMDETLNRMRNDGRTILPWVVPEMGTAAVTSTTKPLPSDGWAGYYKRAFRYMRDNAGVGFISYNTNGNNFINGSDYAARLAGYEAALSSESSYLVTVRPS